MRREVGGAGAGGAASTDEELAEVGGWGVGGPDAVGAAALRTLGDEAVARTILGCAVTGLRNVADPFATTANNRGVGNRVRGTRGTVAGAALRRVADTRRRAAGHAGRLEGIGGAGSSRARAIFKGG